MMFTRILLPLDLTDHNDPALKRASDLARQSEVEIRLLHVIETIAGVDVESEKEFYERFWEKSQETLNAAAAELTAQGHSVDVTTTYGSRGDEILAHAVEQEVDLIIVRSPTLTPEDPRKGLASLSWKLGILAPCDVLLVK